MAGSPHPHPHPHPLLLRAILWRDAMQFLIRRGIQTPAGLVVGHRQRAKSRVSSCWPGQLEEETIQAALDSRFQPQDQQVYMRWVKKMVLRR